jgi:enoyl-CoA hydratase
VACTGHALAAGALVLLSGDLRIGAKGDYKIGLNEVAIRMTLPVFAMELARDRLSKRHLTSATTQARIYNPKKAKDAGYLDWAERSERLVDAAMHHARRLGELPQPAYGATKARERMATIRRIRETLADDMAGRYEP